MDGGNPSAGILAIAMNVWKRRAAVRPLRAHRAVLVSSVLVLAACAPASNSAASPDSGANAEPASACPVENFDAFIERFGREITFQELATADPLVVERFDATAEPEPRLVVEDVALTDVVWPVIPRLDLLGGSGRAYDIAPVADGRMEVRIRTPDTSDQQRYVFGQSPCWQLQRVVDESI